MAKAEKTPAGRNIESLDATPAHLGRGGGPGKSRQPTEFDELIPGWYEEGKIKRIPAQGETDEEKVADLDEMFKAVARAASHHGLGVYRKKEDDPEDPEFTGYNLYVKVQDKQPGRGRTKGSLKDPDTGSFVAPDDDPDSRYAELKAMRERGEI